MIGNEVKGIKDGLEDGRTEGFLDGFFIGVALLTNGLELGLAEGDNTGFMDGLADGFLLNVVTEGFRVALLLGALVILYKTETKI